MRPPPAHRAPESPCMSAADGAANAQGSSSWIPRPTWKERRNHRPWKIHVEAKTRIESIVSSRALDTLGQSILKRGKRPTEDVPVESLKASLLLQNQGVTTIGKHPGMMPTVAAECLGPAVAEPCQFGSVGRWLPTATHGGNSNRRFGAAVHAKVQNTSRRRSFHGRPESSMLSRRSRSSRPGRSAGRTTSPVRTYRNAAVTRSTGRPTISAQASR
jgi:hypothetical protein